MQYPENYNEGGELKLLWTACISGNDTDAFKKIHESLFDGLFLYAQKLLEDEDLADDAVQNLFIRLWTKRESIGEIQKIKSYFYTALRRQVLNQLRDIKLRKLKISFLSKADIEFSPEEIKIKEEDANKRTQQVLEMLNQLPKRQKEVIYLHYFESLDYNQIAEIMQVNYQSVLNLKQKAITKMKTFGLLPWILFLSFLYRNFKN